MNILVTGSKGFLGTHLVRELRSRGHHVVGCDLTHDADHDYIRADVAEQNQVQAAFGMSAPEVIVHLAAEFGKVNGAEYFQQMWRSNVLGTKNVIDCCLATGARLIFASSSEVYGDSQKAWLREEDTALSPVLQNEYALSKWTNEQQIQIARKRGLDATILRFFNAYGEGEDYSPYRSAVCLFAYRSLFGLPVTVYKGYHRDFMHIADWTPTVAAACERPVSGTYNIGGNDYRSVEELYDIISYKVGGGNAEYLEEDENSVKDKRPDISKAVRDLGHSPKIKLEEGIERTLEWMRDYYKINRESPVVATIPGCH